MMLLTTVKPQDLLELNVNVKLYMSMQVMYVQYRVPTYPGKPNSQS